MTMINLRPKRTYLYQDKKWRSSYDPHAHVIWYITKMDDKFTHLNIIDRGAEYEEICNTQTVLNCIKDGEWIQV